MSKKVEKKIDVLAFVVCRNSVLNGDIDNEGAQRIDPVARIAEASPVSAKRIIRDYVFNSFENNEVGDGFDVLIRRGPKTLKSIEEEELKNVKKEDLEKSFYEKYFDTRAFGFTAASKNLNSCKGPVQFNWATSIDPVEDTTDGITNVISYSNEDRDNKSIGRINRIRFGLFKYQATVNATLAQKTGMTEKDVELVLDGIWGGYEEARSTIRSDIDAVLLIAFEHDSLRGNCKPSECYKALTVRRVNGESGTPAHFIDDYAFELDESKLPKGVRIKDLRKNSEINLTHKK